LVGESPASVLDGVVMGLCEMKTIFEMLFENPERQRPLGRSRHTSVDKLNINLNKNEERRLAQDPPGSVLTSSDNF
jgi:hypothetical protein